MPPTNDEILAACKAKIDGGLADDFTIRIDRVGQNAIGSTLARCDQGTLENLLQIEDWLPPLFGGGHFKIACYHVTDRTRAIGTLDLNLQNLPPVAGNWGIIEHDSWAGPKKVSRIQAENGSGGVTHISDLQRSDKKPMTDSDVIMRLVDKATGQNQSNPALDKLLEQMRNDSAARDRQLADANARMDRLLDRLSTPQVAAKPSFDAVALIAALAPITTALLEQRAEDRKETQRLTFAQAKETRELLQAMNAPKGPDPLLERMINRYEKLAERSMEPSSADPSEALQQMMGTMGNMVQFTSKVISSYAERAIPEGSGGGKFWEHAITAIEGLGNAYMSKFGRQPPPQRQPPVRQPAQSQQAPQQALPPAQPQQAQPAARAPAEREQTDVPTTEQIAEAIRQHYDIEELSTGIVQAMIDEDEELWDALDRHNGDIAKVAEEKLGAEWVQQLLTNPTERAYAEGLMEALNRKISEAVAAGKIPRPDEGSEVIEPESARVVDTGEPEHTEPVVAATPAATAPTPAPAPKIEVVKLEKSMRSPKARPTA